MKNASEAGILGLIIGSLLVIAFICAIEVQRLRREIYNLNTEANTSQIYPRSIDYYNNIEKRISDLEAITSVIREKVLLMKSPTNSKDDKGLQESLQEKVSAACMFGPSKKDIVAIIGSESGSLFMTRTFLYKGDVPAFIKWLRDNYETQTTDTCIKK